MNVSTSFKSCDIIHKSFPPLFCFILKSFWRIKETTSKKVVQFFPLLSLSLKNSFYFLFFSSPLQFQRVLLPSQQIAVMYTRLNDPSPNCTRGYFSRPFGANFRISTNFPSSSCFFLGSKWWKSDRSLTFRHFHYTIMWDHHMKGNIKRRLNIPLRL